MSHLACWSSAWVVGALDPTTGRIRRQLVSPTVEQSRPVSGFFAHERRTDGALVPLSLWRSAAGLHFQAAGIVWPLSTPALSFAHEVVVPFVQSRFFVRVAGQTVWDLTYRHRLRGVLSRIDLTYDALDHEKAYFLAFVAANAADTTWQAGALASWQPVGAAA